MSDLVDEDNVPDFPLAFEDVPCPPLGGSVRVQALDLEQGLAMEARIKALIAKAPEAGDAAVYPVIAELLHVCVVGKKGRPVKSIQRWRNFGAAHNQLAITLFNTAWRLSGMSGEDAKKN